MGWQKYKDVERYTPGRSSATSDPKRGGGDGGASDHIRGGYLFQYQMGGGSTGPHPQAEASSKEKGKL